MRWLALACGLFAAGVLGLYLLVAGHRADLSTMPGEAPSAATQAVPAPAPAGAPAGQAASAGDAAPADAPPAAQAAAGTALSDPLAAAVERLRAGLPAAPSAAPPGGAPQDTPGEAAADAAPHAAQEARGEPPASGDTAPGDAAPGDAGREDNPAASSAEAARPPAAGVEPPVGTGRHVTAQGVRWVLSVAGGRPSLVIPLDDGGEAHVQVTPGFLALNIHAMSRNVEAVRSLIQRDYLGRAGDYLFTPDGRLARL